MRWILAMMAVGMSYAVASEFMPNFEESARPTALLLLVVLMVMGLRSTYVQR